MAAKVENKDTEKCLRELLILEGYELNKPRSFGENGVDIFAKRDGEILHIEVTGYKSSGPARAKDFYEIFFRTISRLNDGATNCIIALPKQAELGLPQRSKQHGIAWKRIGIAFPELEIWLVDVENRYYEKTGWVEWLEK